MPGNKKKLAFLLTLSLGSTSAAAAATTTVSVNAGGSTTGSFVADAYFSGGSTYSTTNTIDTSQITGTVPPQAVFQTERYGASTYTIPGFTASSAATVTLYFQENYVTAAGQRLFNVAINGTTVLSNFDIYATAGGQNKAIAQTFNATANSSGQFVIQLSNGSVQSPKICGITVVGGTPPPSSYTLTVTKSGTGTGTVSGGAIDCGSTCSAGVNGGTTVTLTATAGANSTFASWSGCTSSSGATCSVTMNANMSVTAAFNTVPVTTTISINAGGSATGSFVADVDYSGGSTYSTTKTIDTSLVSSPVPPQAVFQSERYGAFTYTIPGLTAGGAYMVTLYFEESYVTAAGQRLFNVAVSGSTVLSGFDIFAAAGAQNRAIARAFNATASSSGQVVIAFTAGSVENPKVSGITVAPGSVNPTNVTLTVNKSGSGSGTVTGGGINCGSTCSATMTSGTVVTLTAAPASGSTITWGGACSGTATTCTVNMSANQTVTATFNTGTTVTGPCDIYQAANTPCVAAHSTVRALYGAYNSRLYQVRRASDNTTRDITVLTAGGFANTSLQDSFCANTTCTILIIYDQSPQHNDLPVAPGTTYMTSGLGANAADGRITVGGHTVHGIYVTGNPNYVSNKAPNVAYRLNSTKSIATGNQAEAMYMVVDGTRYSSSCCFDYGNAETSGRDDGNGTMEALYWGTDTAWGGRGDGNGPWIAADLENGMFKGNATCNNCNSGPWTGSKSLNFNFVTAMLKGPAANTFALKGGNAQSGTLTTMWNGARPTPNYYPKKLQGAIILGTGGDGSSGGTGTFFEGAMTSGVPSDAVDDAVQANIVAAGYGR